MGGGIIIEKRKKKKESQQPFDVNSDELKNETEASVRNLARQKVQNSGSNTLKRNDTDR